MNLRSWPKALAIGALYALPIALVHGAPARSRVAVENCAPEIAEQIRTHWLPNERTAERAAEASFPGDLWSQGDDFHNTEGRYLRSLAEQYSAPIGCALWLAHNEMRSAPETQIRTRVPPCRPRPFYD